MKAKVVMSEGADDSARLGLATFRFPLEPNSRVRRADWPSNSCFHSHHSPPAHLHIIRQARHRLLKQSCPCPCADVCFTVRSRRAQKKARSLVSTHSEATAFFALAFLTNSFPLLRASCHRILGFVRRNQSEPLSPLWEAFITIVWQPSLSRDLELRQAGEAGEDATVRLAQLAVIYHPFNLSHEGIVASRSRNLLELLAVCRAQMGPDWAAANPAWWPQEAVGMVELIKREREEMDRLGYIVGVEEQAEEVAEVKPQPNDEDTAMEAKRACTD